jgi:ADP-heptose:LPS heptosyltransferase
VAANSQAGLVDASTRVLVLSACALGDQILRAPLFAGLAEAAASVTVLVQGRFETLLGRIDPRLRPLPTTLVPWLPGYEAEEDRVLEAIEADDPDLVVHAAFMLHPSPVRILRGLDRYQRVGLGEPGGAWEEVLDVVVRCAADEQEAAKAARLVRALIDPGLAARLDPRPRLRLRSEDMLAARAVTAPLGFVPEGYAVVAPAATTNSAGKRWRTDGAAEVIAGLTADHDLPALLVGTVAERPVLEEIERAGRRRGAEVGVWVGDPTGLPTLLGLIAGARLAVGIDSAPIHIAAAFGLPVIVGHGGAHWPRFLPAAQRGGAVVRRLPCFGCEWHCWLEHPACLVHEPDDYLELVARALADEDGGFEIREHWPDPELERAAAAAVAAGRTGPDRGLAWRR